MKTSVPANKLALPSSRWLAYATASAASALGLTHSADAEIHYSGKIDARFSEDASVVRSFLLSGGEKLVFLKGYGVDYGGARGDYYGVWFGIRGGAVSNQFRGHHGSGGAGTFYVSRLRSHKEVSQGMLVDNLPNLLNFMASSYGAGDFGARQPGKPAGSGFIGFRFNTGAGMQYGWARISVRDRDLGAAYGFILVDYAWGDPGESIKTGQTSSIAEKEFVPDAGSLGLLAVGASGLMVWRERRKTPHGPPNE